MPRVLISRSSFPPNDMLLRHRLLSHRSLATSFAASPPAPRPSAASFRRSLSLTARLKPANSPPPKRSSAAAQLPAADELVRTALFVPPGVPREEVTSDMLLPGSNIVLGPYAGHAQIKQVEFVKSSARARDCPKDDRPEFAILGRSNVGKSSLINALVRKKEFALTSKKPGPLLLLIARSLDWKPTVMLL